MNNKKLFKGALVLFASILMAVSCTNNSTDGGKDGSGSGSGNGIGSGDGTKQETVTVTTDTLKKAATTGLGETLEINTSKTIQSLATKTTISVSKNTITIQILDTTFNTASDGSKAKTKAALEKVFAALKTQMATQGVNITAAAIPEAQAESDISSAKAVSFTLEASKIADTDSKKFVLPATITGLTTVKIVIAIGQGQGTWVS